MYSMQYSTHRIKTQEKKLVKRAILTVVTIIGLFLLSIYIGLPLLAKIIVTFSSSKPDKTSVNNTSSIILLPPVLNPIVEATNSSKIKVSGFTQPDTTVEITLNETDTFKITPETDGSFSSKAIVLKDGSNTISAVTIQKDQTSEAAPTLTILYKKDAPTLTINSPKDGEKITGDTDSTTIQGETDADNRVTINGRTVIVSSTGKFTYNAKLSNGDNEYKITAIDQAGNKIDQELTINYSP
jgi:hypothetical protein